MSKNHTLKELADIGARAAYLAEKESKCTLCHAITVDASRPLYEETSVNREAFTKAVLNAVGYEFPKDEEREAFERWQKSHTVDPNDAFFDVWKAGREELRRAQMTAKEQDKSELPEPPASGMKVCYWKDMPKDSNPYSKSMWAFGKWVGLYRDSNPAPDTIVAYLPETKVNEGFLTAEYKTEPAWIPWAGGECPLPDGVNWWYKTRDGFEYDDPEAPPKLYPWRHTGGSDDIVAYRVWE